MLTLGNNEATSNLYVLKDFDLIIISKIRTYLLEYFVRVREQEDLTQKWNALAKGNERA